MERMRTPRGLLLALIILTFVAFSVRSISMQWSPLPYNIDGLSELRVAQGVLATGHLDFPDDTSISDTYVADLPVLGLFIAFFSSALGVDPLTNSQLVTALLGAVAVSIVFLMFRSHWRTRRGAVASFLVLALAGSFVFSAGCTWKETMGFVLLALALYSFPLRKALPYRLLMVSSLLLIPFTHHLVAVVSFVTLTFAVILEVASRQKGYRITRDDTMDAATVVSAWALVIAYYAYIDLPYLDYLSPSTDLYLFVAVAALILMVGIRMSRRERPLTRLPLGLAVPLVGAALMVVNYVHPIFTGIPGPAAAIAVPLVAYLILVAPGWEGAKLALVPRGGTKNLLLAMFLGPLSLIAFAFVRSNDATSQLIIYRSFDFVLIPFALLVGIGFARLVKRTEPLVGAMAGVSLVIVLSTTLPVAYSSQTLFGVENQTYWYEYDAFEWLSEHGVERYTSDQRLGETGWRLFDLEYGRGLPYDLREGIALNKSSFYVLENSWSTEGAQEFPLGVVVVNDTTIDSILNDSNIVYIGGSSYNLLVCFLTR
ncbi:MAG: hypothetical protein C4K47_06965 [Candidatus Thorarchaeota archaeon]|nr:MAG: hypothetical protein C4K47_06965 [Candidatus Thorarchaeota archaeon]